MPLRSLPSELFQRVIGMLDDSDRWGCAAGPLQRPLGCLLRGSGGGGGRAGRRRLGRRHRCCIHVM